MQGPDVGLILFTLFLWRPRLSASDGRNSQLAEMLHRPIRAVAFPESSSMGLFIALAVPLEDPANSVSLSYFFEANYALPANSSLFGEHSEELRGRLRETDAPSTGATGATDATDALDARGRGKRAIDRATVYAVLRNKFQSAGLPGLHCLLRSICEASEYPLEHNGMLGDVLRVIFTPSSSMPEDHLPDGLIEAELKGRNGTCYDYYSYCPVSLFDLIGILL